MLILAALFPEQAVLFLAAVASALPMEYLESDAEPVPALNYGSRSYHRNYGSAQTQNLHGLIVNKRFTDPLPEAVDEPVVLYNHVRPYPVGHSFVHPYTYGHAHALRIRQAQPEVDLSVVHPHAYTYSHAAPVVSYAYPYTYSLGYGRGFGF